jgi:beta-lactamase regulating signal transducer with metallopeptidase domain
MMFTLLEFAARNALGAALLASVALVLCLVIRRPAVRNALWLIVLVRLLLPPMYSVPIPGVKSVDSGDRAEAVLVADTPSPLIVEQPIERGAEPPQNESPVVVGASSHGAEALFREPHGQEDLVGREAWQSGAPERADANRGATGADALPGSPDAEARSAAQSLPVAANQEKTRSAGQGLRVAANQEGSRSAAQSLRVATSRIIVAIWALGALLVLSRATGRIWRFQRCLRDAVLAPPDVQRQAGDIARRIGVHRCPAVWLVPGRVPPMLWMPGLLARRARLILPTELFIRLDIVERCALIAHELAHLRRRDPWVRWLELLTAVVYWWHPLLGFIRCRLRQSEEQCCDAWVVAKLSERKAYASALLETVFFLDGPDVPAQPALASGASPVHNLKRRVTMIMLGTSRGGLTRFGLLAMLGVAVAALAFSPAFSQDEPKKGPPRKDFDPKREDPPPKDFDRKRADPPPENFDRKNDPFDPRSKKDDRTPRTGFDAPNKEDVEKARNELDLARKEMEKAMKRVRDAELSMMKLTGGRGLGFPGGPGERGPNGPNPFAPGSGPPGHRDGPMMPPLGPGGGPGMERQFQEMQKQLEEMRKMIEELRREMRKGPGQRDPLDVPKRELPRRPPTDPKDEI